MCANTLVQQKIKELEMTYVGKIFEDSKKTDKLGKRWLRLPVVPDDLKDEKCLVYIWVRCTGNCEPFKVMYVGKAGRKLHDRFKQHEGGFRPNGSIAGKRNAESIREVIAEGDVICVYARVSKLIDILGRKNIPSCCLEEEALQGLFVPAWNNLRPPVP